MKPALWWVRGVPVWPAPPCACHPVMPSKLPLSTAGGEDNVTGRVLPLKTSRQGNVDRSPQREDPRLGAASPAGASGRVRRPGRGRQTPFPTRNVMAEAPTTPAGARGATV